MGWPDRKLLDLFGITVPIVQAPMANFSTTEMAIAAAGAGALGSVPCASLSPEQIRAAIAAFRKAAPRPVNVNFFCHAMPPADAGREAAWRARLAPYYLEMGLDPQTAIASVARLPFDEAGCVLVEELRPEIVSFHFGLPEEGLRRRVKATGAKMIASATTVAEARWLEERGCDAVIAMGVEAGGHRGNFLSHDMSRQVGTFALVPQIADAVRVPVIAAGGIADGRGMAAAFLLGASAVQIGTAFLHGPESRITPMHRAALAGPDAAQTQFTTLFSGRPARGIPNRLMRDLGAMNPVAPPFPHAGTALAPLRAAAEAQGDPAFSNMWAGQASLLARPMPAGERIAALVANAERLLSEAARETAKEEA